MAIATQLERYSLLIDGKLVESASGKTFMSVNPADNEPLAEVAEGGEEDVDRAVAAARRAFEEGPWSRMTALDRQKILFAMARLVRERLEELATLETRDCGKPIVESRADVANVANTFEYYGSLAPFVYGETIPMPGTLFDYTLREPVGVCALIVPWNFPMLLAAWKLGPCLATGNTAILKPASNTPLGAVRLGQIALEAGLPEGVLNVVPGPGSTVGRALCTHPEVDKISFTGETVTGREILRLAADTIKKVTLELGGKSPSIVFPDADLSKAVPGAIPAIFGNAGQRCTARSRLFVHRRVHDEFLDRFVAEAEAIRVGDPLDAGTQMGPLVSRSQVERVEGYIKLGQEEGARVATGGRRPDGDGPLRKGNFLQPTVLDGVQNKMRVAQEEIFGPVLSVIDFESLDEVIREANDIAYGLGASIWTRDISTAHTVARKLKAGNISINHPTVNYIYAPFGGYKQSGLGRELGRAGIDLFTQIKNVVVDLGA
jgi:acyl-CoA reductase-like NAD-dependent aldehyde dehydrogenase